MPPAADFPTKQFASKQAFTSWLDKHHAKSDGIVVQIAKRGSGIRSVTYPEAVEVALCYGWIDGQGKRLDDDYYLQRFTPRRARSIWSKINRTKATALIESGAMKAAGMREIERAQADGRWDAAYDSPTTARIPETLERRLRTSRAARTFFESLDSRNRYAIVYRLSTAKKPETVERLAEKFFEMLKNGEALYPPR
jgi:uncharacterized protein YdeI (YjbR/CyaY-like superfamily)